MPYQWIPTPPRDAGGAARSAAREALRLWPHRSMTNRGFAIFIGASFALICMPLIAVLGSPVLWGLLPFMVGTLWLAWSMIRWKDRQMELVEELTLWDDRVALVRREARGGERRWEANPYWVQVRLHDKGGPVENYVTLEGGDRKVEIGAFLSPEERAALFDDLSRRLPARP